MQIEGTLVQVMQVQTGSGSRGKWQKQEFVIESSGQYPKKIACQVWGDKVDSLKAFKIGATMKISINLESREYNDRWYTEVKAWKLEAGNESGNKETAQPVTVNTGSVEEDDLPF